MGMKKYVYCAVKRKELDVPECTDFVESCEDCPRYMDDCDGKDDRNERT